MVLWSRILLPLLVVLGIIIVSIFIFVFWGALVDYTFARKQQRQLRKAVKEEVKENCDALREMVDAFFLEMVEQKLNSTIEEVEENEE